MIYAVKHSPSTVARLMASLSTHLDLLRFAAGGPPALSWRGACEGYLIGLKYSPERAASVAAWAFAPVPGRTPPQDTKRSQALIQFAASPGRPAKKRLWIAALQEEIDRLKACVSTGLNGPAGSLKRFGAYTGHSRGWATAAKAFFQEGYSAFRNSHIPAAVAGEPFGSQEFLVEYADVNQGLIVCPACDASRYLHHGSKRHHSTLDHYFPQEQYPHLALHPFNLVPLCSACNTGIKGRKDPLTGRSGRRGLDQIWLPYRDAGLASKTLLEVQVGAGSSTHFAGLRERAPGGDLPADALQVFRELYGIPNRWDDRVHELGPKLFRRVRQYFMEWDDTPQGTDSAMPIRDRLDRLVAFLVADWSREPDAFALAWWLATLVETEFKDGFNVQQSPLAQEISSWSLVNTRLREELVLVGRHIRQLLVDSMGAAVHPTAFQVAATLLTETVQGGPGRPEPVTVAESKMDT